MTFDIGYLTETALSVRGSSTLDGEAIVDLPHRFRPRPYQQTLWQQMVMENVRRAVVVWHRRAGKDKTYFQIAVAKAQQRVGTYWYMLPKTSQARKVIWQGRGKDNVAGDEVGGIAFLEHIPPELVKSVNNTEMFIEFHNGSILYVMGSDNYDNYVGGNPLGVVFSEWSLCDPSAWDYIRPILAENGGWAMFCYTPRGRNHGYDLYRVAKKAPDRWYLSLLTADDTRDEAGNPIITPEIIENERADGMAEDMIEQEFYCSFDAAQPGVIFAAEMKKARAESRIGHVPVEAMIPVHTFWDWGIGDDTAVWLVQIVGKEIRMVGFYKNNGQKLEHYLKWCEAWLRDQGEVVWGYHVGPHDTNVRSLQTGKTLWQIAKDLGYEFLVVPRVTDKKLSIDALRRVFARLWFSEDACNEHHGLDALETYRYEWDEKRKVFKKTPHHTWASNPADALQQLGLWVDQVEGGMRRKKEAPANNRKRMRVAAGGSWQGM